MRAAARESLPDEGERRLLARIAHPGIQQWRSNAVPAGSHGPFRPGLQQQPPVSMIAEQIGEHRDHRRHRNGQQSVTRRAGRASDNGFP